MVAPPRPPVRDMDEATKYGDRICEWCNQQVPRLHQCAVEPIIEEPAVDPSYIESTVK